MTDIKILTEYSKVLDKIRSRKSIKKKVYYFLLYCLVIPVFRIIRTVIKPVYPRLQPAPCDILVLGTCVRDIEGSEHIWSSLAEKGYKIEKFYVKSKTELFKYALQVSCSKKIPCRLFLYACFARYLAEKYTPKLLCNFHSYDTLPSFVREELHGSGITIYIPHALIPITYLYTSIDYDYYLLFGKTSEDNLFQQPLRIGHTKIIRTGSPMIKKDFYLPPVQEFSNKVLYFSNWLVGVNPDYTRDFEIVLEWAKVYPDYTLLIRLHPNEDGKYISASAQGIKNIIILEKTLSIKEALALCDISITSYSVSAIESAMMNRPVVIANYREFNPNSDDIKFSDKYLFAENYFEPRARNASELQERIKCTYKNYPHYLARCRDFVKLHLEYGTDSGDYITSVLEKIYHGQPVEISAEIQQNLEGLKQPD